LTETETAADSANHARLTPISPPSATTETNLGIPAAGDDTHSRSDIVFGFGSPYVYPGKWIADESCDNQRLPLFPPAKFSSHNTPFVNRLLKGITYFSS